MSFGVDQSNVDVWGRGLLSCILRDSAEFDSIVDYPVSASDLRSGKVNLLQLLEEAAKREGLPALSNHDRQILDGLGSVDDDSKVDA